jgi:hypothetical protein
MLEQETRASIELCGLWDARSRQGANFRYMTRWNQKVPFELSQQLKVPAQDSQLFITVCRSHHSPAATIEVLLDGKKAVVSEVGPRGTGEDEPSPVAVPIGSWHGKEVDVRIRITSEQVPIKLDWRQIAIGTQPPSLDAAARLVTWKSVPHLHDESHVGKEAHNRFVELRAILDANDFDEACQLIARTPHELVCSAIPDPRDAERTISLGAALAGELNSHPKLQDRMKQEYGPLAELRLNQAIASKAPTLVEAVTVQFAGTSAAQIAEAWLGDRALSSGQFSAAVRRYDTCLAEAPLSIREKVRQRLAIAKDRSDSEKGDLVLEKID